jgi:hypothetical protein
MESVSENAVFEAIRDRMAARDYLDTVPGVPQEGGNLWVGSPAPPSRRSYHRGTPEYVQARREGLIEPLPALAAATAEMIEEAEAVTGFRLPPLLRRLYLEVGNGGFGPGTGIPTADNTHEVTQVIAPGTRVAYVDADPHGADAWPHPPRHRLQCAAAQRDSEFEDGGPHRVLPAISLVHHP